MSRVYRLCGHSESAFAHATTLAGAWRASSPAFLWLCVCWRREFPPRLLDRVVHLDWVPVAVRGDCETWGFRFLALVGFGRPVVFCWGSQAAHYRHPDQSWRNL